MRPNAGRKRTMLTEADTLEQTRPLVAAMVERATRRAGSRMAAYHDVGRDIGRAAEWVRKLVGRRRVVVELHDFLNIAAAYRRLCERIEAEAERERMRVLALRGEVDAVLESACPLVELVARAEADRKPDPSPPGEG